MPPVSLKKKDLSLALNFFMSASFAMVLYTLVVFVAPPSWPLVALLTVQPPHKTTDGATVWMGVLYSCARSSNAEKPNCNKPTLHPQYNFSVLSTVEAEALAAATPSHAIAICSCVTLILLFLSWMVTCWVVVYHRSKVLTAAGIKRYSSWLSAFACFSFAFGLVTDTVISIAFRKPAKQFNDLKGKLVAVQSWKSAIVLVPFFIFCFVTLRLAIRLPVAAIRLPVAAVRPAASLAQNDIPQDLEKNATQAALGSKSSSWASEATLVNPTVSSLHMFPLNAIHE